MKKLFNLFLFVFLSTVCMYGQKTVTGTVLDADGIPLIGVNILADGTTVGTVTDIDGLYSLEVPAESSKLIFSYAGYTTSEMEIGNSSILDLTMEEGVQLEEIVVTGYTEIARSKAVSAITSVDSKQFENKPVANINQALQGQAPGVYTTANSGQPGAQQQVRIRGTGSINAGRNPLYVIDGIIINQGNVARLDGGMNATDILSLINPNDIERMDVLKDASATALYGARGSNGVIVITTKSGKAGKTEVTAKVQYGTTQPTFGNFQMMNAQQQWDYERELLANSGFDQATIDELRSPDMLDNTTDWVDAAFRTGTTQTYELQASGGNEKTQFFTSAGWFDQQGTLIESDFDRANIRTNVDHKASDKLKLGANLSSSYSRQQNAVNGNRFQSPLLASFLNTPLQGATDPETGELYTGLEDDWIPFIGDNFLYSQPLNYVKINSFRLLSNVFAEYSILDNLKLSQSGAVDFLDIEEGDFDDPTTNDGVNDNGALTNSFANNRTLTTQTKLRFTQDVTDNQALTLLGVYEYQRFASNSFDATGRGFASGKLQTLASSAEPDGVGGSNSDYSFISMIGQANYDLMNKYFVSASVTRNGSSRFGANNKWANFFSIGASWNIGNEGILPADIFDDLRLRVSYGTAGNADIGNFQSLELYGFGAAYLGNPGSSPSQIANPDLTWETSKALDIGLDFALFKGGKISGSIDYYNKVSEDLLLNVPVSATSGFTSALRNIGQMQNSGIELALNASPITSRDPNGIQWDSRFNIAWNTNEITDLPDGEDIDNGSQLYRVGSPIRTIYGPSWAGVNPANGQPLWHTADDDENISGVTNTYAQADDFIIGNAEPDFTAGWTNTVSYQGFSLSAFLYTAQGHEIYNSSRRFIESDGQRFGWNFIADAADYWKNPGDVSSRPQGLVGGNRSANSFSSRYLEDASFIRLRDITASYSLPTSILSQIGSLQRVRAYVQGTNLWTMTNYSGFDPEADEDGSEFFRYPVGKAVTFGIDVTF